MYNFESLSSFYELNSLVKKHSLDFYFYCEKDINYIFKITYNSINIAIIEFLPSFNAIQWFEVFPEFRGAGHGIKIIKELLSQFEQELISNNQSFIIHITPLNENVELFWEKCGFTMTKNHPTMSICLNKPK